LARGGAAAGVWDVARGTMLAERPVLPAPHQVAAELWKTVVETRPTSARSLLYHSWVTLASTLLGFATGTALGAALAVGIVHSRTLDRSLMPWIVASQTIPILAVAPMVIVVLASVGLTGLLPKAAISTYLSFFPVTVGVVKGLRSPDAMLLDLMRTYGAGPAQTLAKLRLPAAVPFLFASMKIAVAASLVGAIVGELPTGAQAGLGARLLAGSYYGQTVQIWAALVAASAMAGLLVAAVGLAERAVVARSGARA
jgi:NitT/TauT family transport system permease protein